jgi:hypothetical protein
MKHTATPWKLRKHESLPAFIEGPKSPTMPYALEVMGDDYTGYGDEEQREADAAFIVQAVNAHDALVEALRSADRLIKKVLPKFNWGESALDANAISLLNEVPAKVTTALKRAEG